MTYIEIIESLSKCLEDLDNSDVLISEISDNDLQDLYRINFEIYCKILGFQQERYLIKK